MIGDGLAQQIKQISMDDPIGKQIRIGQALYTVHHRYSQPWKKWFFNEDINQAAIIPLAGVKLISKDAKINNGIIITS